MAATNGEDREDEDHAAVAAVRLRRRGDAMIFMKNTHSLSRGLEEQGPAK